MENKTIKPLGDRVLVKEYKTKEDKISFLKALGAKVYICPSEVPAGDSRSYYQTAKKIADSMKKRAEEEKNKTTNNKMRFFINRSLN